MQDCPAVNCPRADCPVVNCPVSGELSELRRDSGRGVVEYMQISHCQGRRILTSALVSVSVFDLAKAHSDSLKLLHGHWTKSQPSRVFFRPGQLAQTAVLELSVLLANSRVCQQFTTH